jgi:hypothetical protein
MSAVIYVRLSGANPRTASSSSTTRTRGAAEEDPTVSGMSDGYCFIAPPEYIGRSVDDITVADESASTG